MACTSVTAAHPILQHVLQMACTSATAAHHILQHVLQLACTSATAAHSILQHVLQMACTSATAAHPVTHIINSHCFNNDLCDFSSVFTPFCSRDIAETRNFKNHINPCSGKVQVFLITILIVSECKILKSCTNVCNVPYLLKNVHISAKSGCCMKHGPQTTHKD